MTKPIRAVAFLVTLVIGIACTACSSDSSSPAAALPTRSSAAASSTRSSVASHVPPPPRIGQCRNTPANDGWVDNTPVVQCSKTHTLETVEVIKPVEKLTLAQVKQLAASCESPAVNYLGISFPAVRTLNLPVVFWPSPAQRAAGQNWVRCDVGVRPSNSCCRQLVPLTGSLRGAVGSDPVRFQMCIDQLPDPPREQPFTSCKKPHRTEILPTGLQLSVTHYPSAAVLAKNGRTGCAKLVSHRTDRKSLVVTSSWQSRGNWSGGSLFGFCWIHRKAGLMPPIK
jgi:Septum formation